MSGKDMGYCGSIPPEYRLPQGRPPIMVKDGYVWGGSAPPSVPIVIPTPPVPQQAVYPSVEHINGVPEHINGVPLKDGINDCYWNRDGICQSLLITDFKCPNCHAIIHDPHDCPSCGVHIPPSFNRNRDSKRRCNQTQFGVWMCGGYTPSGWIDAGYPLNRIREKLEKQKDRFRDLID